MQRTYFEYEVGICEDMVVSATLPDGTETAAVVAAAIEKPVCSVKKTTMAKTDEIRALKESGFPWKKGMKTYSKPLRKFSYHLADEMFLEIATLERVEDVL